MRSLFILLLLLITDATWADPPMKVVYQKTSSATFGWFWPYHTTQTSTSIQTYPSPYGSSIRQVPTYLTNEDVSQYRFHNSHLTYQNQWGYFFPNGTRAVQFGTGSAFVAPQSAFIQSR